MNVVSAADEHREGVRALLDDPATAEKTLVNRHIGELSLDLAVSG